jgi:hypothetical protein
MRTFTKYLAAIIGSVLAFVALSGGTAWLLVGNADNATSTAMSVISQDLAGKAAGSVLIESLASEADLAVKAELERESGPLAEAAAVGVRASEAAISMAIHGVYSAVNAASSVVVDLKPVLSAVAVELHRVDSRIPADLSAIAAAVPGNSDMSIEVDGSKLGILRTTFSIIGAWWVLLVVALALLVLAGLCDRRAPVRRWRVTGISLAIPSAALIVISLAARFAAPAAESGDANTSTLISALLSVVQGTMMRLSGIVLVLALAIIVVTIVVKPSGTDGEERSTAVAA